MKKNGFSSASYTLNGSSLRDVLCQVKNNDRRATEWEKSEIEMNERCTTVVNNMVAIDIDLWTVDRQTADSRSHEQVSTVTPKHAT